MKFADSRITMCRGVALMNDAALIKLQDGHSDAVASSPNVVRDNEWTFVHGAILIITSPTYEITHTKSEEQIK